MLFMLYMDLSFIICSGCFVRLLCNVVSELECKECGDQDSEINVLIAGVF